MNKGFFWKRRRVAKFSSIFVAMVIEDDARAPFSFRLVIAQFTSPFAR